MELDLTYDNLCKDVFEELDHNLQYKFCGSKLKKRHRNSKPYWAFGQPLANNGEQKKEFIRYRNVNKGIKNELRKNFQKA